MNINDIALSMQEGLGVRGVLHTLAVFGSAEAVYGATRQELTRRAELREDVARGIEKRTAHSAAEREMRYLERNGLQAIASTDPDYPAMLRETSDYPHVLYVLGSVEALGQQMVSMVGTRAATQYGQRMCEILVGRLGELCPEAATVSGLAFGIDAAAHRASLGMGIRTIAVLPAILPEVVPSQNRALAEEIIAHGGALVSELHSQTKMNGKYYIPRNRIIAALSEGTVVVESPMESGALSTAEFAFGYERTLMAVPGRAGDRCSEGANALIRLRRATMVCTGDDIVRELGWNANRPTATKLKSVVMPELSPTEQNIIASIPQSGAIGLDELSMAANMPVAELAALLLGLELAGVVRALPGKMYEL